jgi:N-acetylneuraminic acid mutarotase
VNFSILPLLLLASVAAAAAPVGRSGHTAVWTGSALLIWGGATPDNVNLGDGWLYRPESHTWTPISSNGAPTARRGHTAVWTGTEMIVWGGATNSLGGITGDGARYNPALDQWTTLTDVNAPGPRTGHRAVWTGTEMIVWSGSRADFSRANDGARFTL